MLQLIPRVEEHLVTLEVRVGGQERGDEREPPAEQFYRTLFNWVRRTGQTYLILDFLDHRPDQDLLHTVEMAAKRLAIPIGLVGLHYKDEKEALLLARRTPLLMVAPSARALEPFLGHQGAELPVMVRALEGEVLPRELS